MTAFVNTLVPIPPEHPGMRAGSVYYSSPIVQAGATTNSVSTSTVYYQPFILPGMAIDRIGLETTTGAGSARMGIYSNLNGAPDKLIIDAGILDVSGIAINEISLANTLYLPQAWVWVCSVFSTTPTVRTGTAANLYLIGSSVTSSSTYRAISATLAYGALPAQAFVVSLANSAQSPIMLLRKT